MDNSDLGRVGKTSGAEAMGDMVERVAKALWHADSMLATGVPRQLGWIDESYAARYMWHDLARVVIEEMREPTQAMVDAWANAPEPSVTMQTPQCEIKRLAATSDWQVMIDAALAADPTPSITPESKNG